MGLSHSHLCRSKQLGSADKAAVRRLVTGAFQRVIATGGQSLGEVRQPSIDAIAHMNRKHACMHACKFLHIRCSLEYWLLDEPSLPPSGCLVFALGCFVMAT